MYGRLITFMVFVLLSLMATAFAFNWLWVKAFGPGGGPVAHQPQKSAEELAEDHKEREAEHREKVKENIEKHKHSNETLTKAAESGIPRSLRASEYDPKTGKAAWPPLLMSATFTDDRQALEQALSKYAATPGSQTRSRAHAAAETLLATLKEHIKDVRTVDYLAAREFVERIAHMLKSEGD